MTTAILGYGISLAEGFTEPEEWLTDLLEKRGFKNPYDNFPNCKDLVYHVMNEVSEKWTRENKEVIEKWFKLRRETEKELGCTFIKSGHYDWEDSPHALIVMESMISCDQLSEIELPRFDTGIKHHYDSILDKFCEELGLINGKGSWILISKFG